MKKQTIRLRLIILLTVIFISIQGYNQSVDPGIKVFDIDAYLKPTQWSDHRWYDPPITIYSLPESIDIYHNLHFLGVDSIIKAPEWGELQTDCHYQRRTIEVAMYALQADLQDNNELDQTTFSKVFSSLNKNLEKVYFTQSQIVELFSTTKSARIWENNTSNLFLFKKDCSKPAIVDNLMVAMFYSINNYNFAWFYEASQTIDLGSIAHCNHRLFVPK